MREFLTHPPAALTAAMPVISLLIFVGISLLVAWFLLTDRRPAHYRRMEHFPLDDSAGADAAASNTAASCAAATNAIADQGKPL